MPPRVSICIPTYHQSTLTKRLLDSVFQQTYTDFEVILSDNSNDDSVKTVAKTYNSDKISYFKNVPPLSMTENWNNSIHLARGEYVKIMFIN